MQDVESQWAELSRGVEEILLEAELKERRRTTGRPGHESRPPSAHDPRVVTEV